jgi:hypothetical protein
MCEGSAMSRVKVLYHDNCFDGAASASLFARFYHDCIDERAEFVFAGKSHGTGDVYTPHDFDADVNAVVDFRFSSDPRLEWWFDHHVSGFPTAADAAHFKSHPRPHQFFDPTARSCAKYLAETCARVFGWDFSAHRELVEWADIIDGAKFESPQAAVKLAEPALQLMTWVENNHDPALKRRFIEDLGQRTLADLAGDPYVKDALAPILAKHANSVAVVRARASCEDRIVYFDVSEDGLDGHNKFIPYFLYPEAEYVVGVSATATRTKVSVGSNPWHRPEYPINIAEICERYGGGGHPVVGAISLPAGELVRARQIAREIVDILRNSRRKEV